MAAALDLADDRGTLSIEKLHTDLYKRLSAFEFIKKIKKFDTSVSGMLTVTFKNGYRDYVSRRNLKSVKERLGVK